MNEILTIVLSLTVCTVLAYVLAGLITVRRLMDFGQRFSGEREIKIGPWKRRILTAIGVLLWPVIAYVHWRVTQTTAVARAAVDRGVRVWKTSQWVVGFLRNRGVPIEEGDERVLLDIVAPADSVVL